MAKLEEIKYNDPVNYAGRTWIVKSVYHGYPYRNEMVALIQQVDGNYSLEVGLDGITLLPMVDQPQPPSEVEPSSYDLWLEFHYGYNSDDLTSDQSTPDNDDLPFTDNGNDPDDTQELPIVVDAPAMSLSQLVDAALLGTTPCQRIDALRTLRNGFDWASVPSDALEAEVVDVNQAYEDAVANRRLLSSKMMNDFWGYAELKDYVKAESFTWAVNAVYVLLNKQLSHRRLHAMGAYNA